MNRDIDARTFLAALHFRRHIGCGNEIHTLCACLLSPLCLDEEQEWIPQQMLDFFEETRNSCTIENAMVGRQRDMHYLTNDGLVINGHKGFTCGSNGQNCSLWWIDHSYKIGYIHHTQI